MSTFNRSSAGRLGEPGGTAPSSLLSEFQSVLLSLQDTLSQLQSGDLVKARPVRRAVRAKTAYGMTGDGKSHFWARQNPKDPAWDPTFPPSFKLGDSPRSATVWFEDEIEAWLNSRARAARKSSHHESEAGRQKSTDTSVRNFHEVAL